MKNKIILLLLVIILCGVAWLNVTASPEELKPAQPFNHNVCQYPIRTTNPPDGCDNSDPANPYCAVKGLPENCQEPTPPKKDIPMTQTKPKGSCSQ